MSWPNYYQSRINDKGYLEHFVNKYSNLLYRAAFNAKILGCPILEAGCGIGNVTKALRTNYNLNSDKLLGGFDIDVKMVEYAKKNNEDWTESNRFVIDDIFSHEYDSKVCYVTHGVLEHFNDKDIVFIIEQMRNCRSIHYVPCSGYKIPSFGDERLLMPSHWFKLFEKVHYQVDISITVCKEIKDCYIEINPRNSEKQRV